MRARFVISARRPDRTNRLALAIGSFLLVATGPALPAKVVQQLPRGYVVLTTASIVVGTRHRTFHVMALARRDEDLSTRSGKAPARPLLIYEQRRNGSVILVGRNDHVVLAADEGGQCDPFRDGGGITVRGRFFTVENGVACGQHWTDYVTFRLHDGQGFVFDTERVESWSLNDSDGPNGPALVRDGAPHVMRDRPGRLTRFSDWRPKR